MTARCMTLAQSVNIVTKPIAEHVTSLNVHSPRASVATVIGILTAATNISAQASPTIKKLDGVFSFRSLEMKTKL